MGGGLLGLGLARGLALAVVSLAIAVACTSEPTSSSSDTTPVSTEPAPAAPAAPTPEPSPITSDTSDSASAAATPETPTATPTSAPEPAATATATRVPATPTPTPSRTPAAEPVASYVNGLYGFSVQYPDTWSVNETDSPSPVAIFDAGTEDLSVQAYVRYYRARLTASEAAEQEIAPLAGLPNFRTIIEAPVTLEDGTETYQILYGFGTGQEERRGGLTFVTEDTRATVLHAVGPRRTYEDNLNGIDAFLNSIKIEPQRPFGVARGDALVLSLDDGPITLDPAIAVESQSGQYIGQVFDGLVALDGDLNVVSDLAASWEVSDDGLTYTFIIDPEATFHDGTAVLASDVVYSWERAADPDLASSIARTYLGDIVGFEERASGATESISGLQVVNDQTLTVTIDSPKSYFLSKLTHTAASVVQRANVESGTGTWWLQPVGTGPFAVAEWIPDVAMHLERHADYHGLLPEVENVVFRFHAGVPLRMFEDGEIDATRLSLAEFNILGDEQSPLLDNITTQPQLSVNYLGFNAAVAPFDDVNVRRAFLLALDRQSIVEETLNGIGVLAHGFLPPDLPGYDPDIEEIVFSPAAALAALESSKYGSADGLPEITISTPSLAPHVMEMIAMWQEHLGVSVGIDLDPDTSYFYDFDNDRPGLFVSGWIADYPDPHNFLDVLFHSTSDSNFGRFSSATVDDLLVQARTETDADERIRLYRTAERILVANGAAIPLWFGQVKVLTAPQVQGFVIDAQGRIDLAKVTLTEP